MGNNNFMRLKELRGNISQTEIAKKLGMPQTTYSNYESGKTKPNIDILIKFADFYGVSLDYLCEHNAKNNDLGYIEPQKFETFSALNKLNHDNFLTAKGYISSLLTSQKNNC